ncbi:hypothetical protein ES708_18118 [subsurface metagenome]
MRDPFHRWDRPTEPPRLNDPPRPRRPGRRMTWGELVDWLEAKREARMLAALAARARGCVTVEEDER